MKLRTYIKIAAVIAALFGLGFMLIPDTAVGLYGVKIDPSEQFVCRYFGSALFGLAITWWTIDAAKTLNEALMAVEFGAAAMSLTGFLIGLWDAISGPGNGLTWINPVIYILLSLGFVVSYLSRRKKKQQGS